jgi:hypothetical protein
MPSEAAMRTDLGLGPDESVPSGDPESSLVPLVRNTLARQRQKMLGTMVMLGLQRIVIESGRLNAAMRFHVDARSAAASDRGSTFDLQNRVDVSGSFGFGPWGASAKMSNTIGYVTTERDQTTEEMNTSVDLNSSVELMFKTDYLPLERLAGPGQVDRIKANTLNPDAEQAAADQQRSQRLAAAYQSEASRRAALDKALQPAASPISPASSPSPARTSVPAPLGGSRNAAPKAAATAPTA